MLLIISLACAVFFDIVTKLPSPESDFSINFMETYISLVNFMRVVNLLCGKNNLHNTCCALRFVTMCVLRPFFIVGVAFLKNSLFFVNFVDKSARKIKNAPLFFDFFSLRVWNFLKILLSLSLCLYLCK